MKNTMTRWYLISFVVAIFAGCGGEELPPVQPAPVARPFQVSVSTAPKSLPVRYDYRGDRYRDPFVPLTGEGMTFAGSEDVIVPQLGTLSLKGIIDDGRQRIAIISGGGITYLLKGSQLYDNRQRLVRGITGAIKKDSVLMIAPDKSTKELRLRDNKF